MSPSRVAWLVSLLLFSSLGSPRFGRAEEAPGSPPGASVRPDPQGAPARLDPLGAAARLDPLVVPGEPALEVPVIVRLLLKGQFREAQGLVAAWQYRNSPRRALPLVHLVRHIYRLSLGSRVIHGEGIELVHPPDMEFQGDLAGLEEFYRRAARQILGRPPPRARIHVVRKLEGALHGVHLAGHVVVEENDWEQVARHELVHLLFGLHPGARRLGPDWYWLQEGLAESMALEQDPRLTGRVPRADQYPESPAELWPRKGMWNPPAHPPGVDQMGALLAARMLFGGPSPFVPRVGRVLDGVAAGMSPEQVIAALRGWPWEDFVARWREMARQHYGLGESLPRGPGAWPRRAVYLGPASRGEVPGAARALAAELARGEPPAWMIQDALRLGPLLARRGGEPEREALRVLYRALPLIGLVVPASLRDADWARRVLDELLAGKPSPEALLYMTLMLWKSPVRPRVEEAWARAWEENRERTRWIQAEGIRLSYMGRLEPPEGGFAPVLVQLQEVEAKLAGRSDRDPALQASLDEATAAYAFGSGDFATCEAVVRRQLDRRGVHMRLLLNRAACLHRLGRLEEAEEAYQEGLFLDPDYPGFRLGLGATLLARGRAEAARTVLEEARGKREHQRRILVTLARAREALGEELREEERAAVAEEAAEEAPPGGRSPVPAEFMVMVHTQLDNLVERLQDEAPEKR